MATHLSKYYRDCRLDQGLSYEQLAQLCGYQNLIKGARRIRDFEQTGRIHSSLLESLSEALHIDSFQRDARSRQDDRDFEQWLAEPIAPRVIVRLMPAVYVPWSVDEQLVQQVDGETYCRNLAISLRKDVALIWSRKTAVFFDSSGNRFSRPTFDRNSKTLPRLTIAGKSIPI